MQYFAEVLEEERDKLVDNLTIGNSKWRIAHQVRMLDARHSEDMHTYITKFQWEGAKYPLKQSLKVLSEIIGKVRHRRCLLCNDFGCLANHAD